MCQDLLGYYYFPSKLHVVVTLPINRRITWYILFNMYVKQYPHNLNGQQTPDTIISNNFCIFPEQDTRFNTMHPYTCKTRKQTIAYFSSKSAPCVGGGGGVLMRQKLFSTITTEIRSVCVYKLGIGGVPNMSI
jgi:hypothetical protein